MRKLNYHRRAPNIDLYFEVLLRVLIWTNWLQEDVAALEWFSDVTCITAPKLFGWLITHGLSNVLVRPSEYSPNVSNRATQTVLRWLYSVRRLIS